MPLCVYFCRNVTICTLIYSNFPAVASFSLPFSNTPFPSTKKINQLINQFHFIISLLSKETHLRSTHTHSNILIWILHLNMIGYSIKEVIAMNLHTKKAVAPIIITVIVILWILGYGYSIYIIRPAWTYILIGFVIKLFR